MTVISGFFSVNDKLNINNLEKETGVKVTNNDEVKEREYLQLRKEMMQSDDLLLYNKSNTEDK